MSALRVTLIDNYDSFTFNLVQYLGDLGAQTTVWRNDAKRVDEILGENPDALVLSPGPCSPREAGICIDLIKAAAPTTPLFGVCLGHQAIGEAFGGEVVRAPAPVHGKVWPMLHEGRSVFAGLPSPLEATRYHSLIVDRASLPDCLEITARTQDGLIMGLAHRSLPVHGVQFHPESIASRNGHEILKNFLDLARRWNEAQRKAA